MLSQMPDDGLQHDNAPAYADLRPVKGRRLETKVYLLEYILLRIPLHTADLPFVLKSKTRTYRISIYAMHLQGLDIRQDTRPTTLVEPCDHQYPRTISCH